MNAPAVNPRESERARKSLTLILQALSQVGQNEVAKALSTSESTVSRMKADLQDTCGMFAVCGLKVVPAHYECVDAELWQAVTTLAGVKLDSLRRAPRQAFVERPTLNFEDDAT